MSRRKTNGGAMDERTPQIGMVEARRLPLGLSPRLLTRESAATYLAISPAHFTTHVAPAVPPIAIGAALRWDVKALDRWLDQRTGIHNDVGSRERLLEGL
jgi:hypothetical protein